MAQRNDDTAVFLRHETCIRCGGKVRDYQCRDCDATYEDYRPRPPISEELADAAASIREAGMHDGTIGGDTLLVLAAWLDSIALRTAASYLDDDEPCYLDVNQALAVAREHAKGQP